MLLTPKTYAPVSSRSVTGPNDVLLQATRVMQELAQFYKELANGSSIFCLDTNVSALVLRCAALCCAVLRCAALCSFCLLCCA